MQVRAIAVLLLAACAALCGQARAQAVPSQQKVLYLSAEGLENPYFGAAFAAFRTELDRALPNQTIVYAENLDLARFADPAYRQDLADWLRGKYAGARIDVVVTAGTPAIRFLLGSGLWQDVPTWFSNVNANLARDLQFPPNVAGQTFEVDFGKTVNLVRDVLPRTREIVLVGNPPSQDVYRPFFDQELAPFRGSLRFRDLRGRNIDDVMAEVGRLPDDAVIYRVGQSRDNTGRMVDSFTLLKSLAAAANRPVFVDYTPFIGLGALGGAAVDPEPQGRQAAQAVSAILRGSTPEKLGIVRMNFAPTFDWRQLKRWDIAVDALPAGSQVRYATPGLWERYRWQILLAAAVTAMLAFLVMGLLVERRRRAVAVGQSRARLGELAHLNRNATAMVYSGAVAHELNQPLAAILSNAQAARMMLAMEPPPLDELREIFADIERDDRRAAELIRGMRGLLKKGEARREALDAGDVVSSAVAFLGPEIRMRGVTLRTVLPTVPAPVRGDRIQLQQVVINLAINAMDAMAGLAPAARVVDIRVDLLEGGTVEVSVTDSGPGFRGDLSQVFQAFVTTKAHGTGLGLAITAALVREHGGEIRAANVPGRGACVTFSLPLAHAAADTHASPPAPAMPAPRPS